jgi:adenine-specific DNA-methyltransferase
MNDITRKEKNAPISNKTSNAVRRPARAELIWDGKYDAAGRRVAPLRVALPFQTVETVNESAQDRQRSLQYAPGFGEEEWRNRLIWGDKKYVLPSLLAEFAGKVNLIYIDPPFDTGADFSFTATVPDDPEAPHDAAFRFTKEPSIIEQKAYRDIWGSAQTHLDGYLRWFYETVVLLRELLREDGSIFVHLDWHVGHYGKAVMDEIFGAGARISSDAAGFRNEIVWCYTGPGSPGMQQFNRKHDTIFWYTKSDKWKFNDKEIRIAHHEKTKDNFKQGLRGSGFVADTYELAPEGKIPEDWWEFAIAGRFPVDGVKRVGSFGVSEKPWALIERIIKTGSSETDLVLDCFCGSGTTAAVAERLKRRWIACDLSRFAIHTSRKRLLSIPVVRPFVVQNLGKYERQMWAGSEFGEGNGEKAAQRQLAYIEFVLKLAQATPLHDYTWLHGLKAGRMIHVGAVDAPVSVGDVTQIAAEFKRAIGTGKDAPATNGVDVLGWDFAFELNEVAKQQAAAANIQMRFLRIPRDVMDKRAVEQGDIHFFELAALSVEVKTNRRNVSLKLKDFVIPPDDVPEEVRRAVKHWSQWIDYWAVDWDNQGDTFHNEWQTYRTRKDKSLALEIMHTYPDAGEYAIVVKVIDILGNDTTKTVKVRVL